MASMDDDDVMYCFDDVMSIDGLKNMISQSLDEFGFNAKCGKILSSLSTDIKIEKRLSKEITKRLDECNSSLKEIKKQNESFIDELSDIPSVDIIDFDFPTEYGDDLQDPAVRAQMQRSSRSQTHQSMNFYNDYGQQGHMQMGISHQMPQRAPATVLNQVQLRPLDLGIGMKLYAKKNEVWYKGTLIDIYNKDKPISERKYKVKFDCKGMKTVTSKLIAYTDVPNDTLPVGIRVIALYKDESYTPSYYAGIIAEPPSVRNNNRFLIFFDDGYAQYSHANHLHQVYDQNKYVWEDIHPDSQDFIRGYLQQYPERPMVRLFPGQIIQTEWKGSWWVARVEEVDASLVKMYFEGDQRVEWIYRGSTRLEPLYTELANAEASKQAGKGRRRSTMPIKGNKKPVVEYTRGVDDGLQEKSPEAASTKSPTKPAAPALATPTGPKLTAPGMVVPAAPPTVISIDVIDDESPVAEIEAQKKRSVAKKSTTSRPTLAPTPAMGKNSVLTISEDSQSSLPLNRVERRTLSRLNSDIDIDTEGQGPLGEIVEIDKSQFPVKRDSSVHGKTVTNKCSPACIKDFVDDPVKYKGKNPAIIPFFCGWDRRITKQRNGKRSVLYRTPCGRTLRNINDVDRYLVQTNSKLTIDFFCCDPALRSDIEYIPVRTFCDIKDLSYGKETVPISCVNGIDRQYPDYVEYSNQRMPAKGVTLNLDTDFFVGCDCKDNCRDRKKCRCIQLTVEASACLPDGHNPDAGYQHRRLTEPIITGIYECNSKCGCDSRCPNRVVQNGISLRLQVFKTERKGWGLRSLDDVPAGGFICIYAGQLLTDEGANEDGKQFGDEYLAELDYIEVVERTKEGYESDVKLDDESGSDSSVRIEKPVHDRDSDSTYSGERRTKAKKKGGKKRSRQRRSTANKCLQQKKLENKQKKEKKTSASDTPAQKTQKTTTEKVEEWLAITISDDDDGETTKNKKPAENKTKKPNTIRNIMAGVKSEDEKKVQFKVDEKSTIHGSETKFDSYAETKKKLASASKVSENIREEVLKGSSLQKDDVAGKAVAEKMTREENEKTTKADEKSAVVCEKETESREKIENADDVRTVSDKDSAGLEPSAETEDALVGASTPDAAGTDACVDETHLLVCGESCMETSDADAIESDLHAETNKTDAVETGKTDAVETGKTDAVETGKTDAVETGKTDVIETGKTDVIETGILDSIDSSKMHAVITSVIDAIEMSKTDAVESSNVGLVETSKTDAVETIDEDTVKTSNIDTVESSNASVVGSSEIDAVETSNMDVVETCNTDAINTNKIDTVETSKTDAVETLSKDTVETDNINAVEIAVRLETETSIVTSQADAAQLVDNGSDITYGGYEYNPESIGDEEHVHGSLQIAIEPCIRDTLLESELADGKETDGKETNDVIDAGLVTDEIDEGSELVILGTQSLQTDDVLQENESSNVDAAGLGLLGEVPGGMEMPAGIADELGEDDEESELLIDVDEPELYVEIDEPMMVDVNEQEDAQEEIDDRVEQENTGSDKMEPAGDRFDVKFDAIKPSQFYSSSKTDSDSTKVDKLESENSVKFDSTESKAIKVDDAELVKMNETESKAIKEEINGSTAVRLDKIELKDDIKVDEVKIEDKKGVPESTATGVNKMEPLIGKVEETEPVASVGERVDDGFQCAETMMDTTDAATIVTRTDEETNACIDGLQKTKSGVDVVSASDIDGGSAPGLGNETDLETMNTQQVSVEPENLLTGDIAENASNIEPSLLVTSGETGLESNKMDSEPVTGLADKPVQETDEKIEEQPEILITEPTSLNVDNIELDSDDCDEASSTKEKVAKLEEETDQSLKRTTRSQASSRFHNLPDPKSQKPVTSKAKETKKQKTEQKKSGPLKPPEKMVRTRHLFGEEHSYIMDAKSMGNLGRYLNHSCSPNVFVQNVFVDTHDIRFPWVAFFAIKYIRAGTELTWDYSYEVGSVPDKCLYCYCGSADCRGRLL